MTDTPIRIHTTQTIAVNSNNGLYTKGVVYNIQKKYDVATIYLRLKERNKERGVAKDEPTCREIAKEALVGKDYAMKVDKRCGFILYCGQMCNSKRVFETLGCSCG